MRYLILVCLWLPELLLRAQEIPRVLNYLPETYRAQRQNWAIDQAPDLLIYAANNQGLLEYDGSQWQTVTLPNRSTIRSVACVDDKVFCGGFAEFGFWKKEPHGRLQYISLTGLLKGDRVNNEEIWHIVAGKDRVLFQSFSTIYEYDYQKVVKYSPPGNIMFLQPVEDRLLFQVIEKGLCQLSSDRSFSYLPSGGIFADKIVSAILPASRKGTFWVFTLNHGIFLGDGRTFSPWPSPTNDLFKKYQINKAIRLANGRLAVGTISNGLYLLGEDGNIFLHLNQQNGLQNNTVLNLLQDRSGNLWVALDKGISMVELGSPLTFFNDKIGKIGSVYSAVLFEGYLYLGSNRGVFFRKQGQDDADFRLLEGTQGQVWQLFVKDGQLLCGHNDGTFLIRDNRAIRISPVTGGWKMTEYPKAPGIIVQGTYTGLVVFRKPAGGNWQYDGRIKGFLEPVRDLVVDRKGNIWAAHPYQGMYRIRLDAALREVQEIRYFSTADGLPGDRGLRLFLNRQGDVWIQSDTVLLEVAGERFIRAGISPDFPTKALKYFPASNGAWFGIGEGEVYYQSGRDVAHFDLRLIEEYENILPLDEDTWFFCLEDGYALLAMQHLQHYTARRDIPPLIRAFRLIGDRDSKSAMVVSKDKTYLLPHHLNDLVFSFSMPDYTRTPLFRHYLRGFSSGWSPWQKETTKAFTNLPPGLYTFLLQSNLSGLTASLTFRIAPPWYLTWKGLIVLLLFFALVFLVARSVVGRLLRSQRRFLEDEKEKALEKQRIESANALLKTAIAGKNRELANSTMNLLRKNEMLSSIRDELRHMDAENFKKSIRRLMRLIEEHNTSDHDWEVFEDSFNSVHEHFIRRLKSEFPDLTPGDLRLAAYLRMNLSSKEIAQLLSISIRGVENKRYRLRKKMNLPDTVNLTDFMMHH